MLGFVPTAVWPGALGQHLLFGLFAVNPLHNLLHVAMGIVLVGAVMARLALNAHATSVTWLWMSAGVLALLVPAGLIPTMADGMALNGWDALLHGTSAALLGALALTTRPRDT